MAKTVLVVEDDHRLRVDAAVMLEETGLDVIEMENADDALAYLVEQAASVAAVFTDVQLSGDFDGFELARSVATNWPSIIVLVTSGRMIRPSDLPKTVQFMPKPWLPLDVLTAIGGA